MTKVTRNLYDHMKEMSKPPFIHAARFGLFTPSTDVVTVAEQASCYGILPVRLSNSLKNGIFTIYPGDGRPLVPDTEADYLKPNTLPLEWQYGEHGLDFLRYLLDPAGPYQTMLPHLRTAIPEEVLENRGFIIPEPLEAPGRMMWHFLIHSRFPANPGWPTFLWLRKKGVDRDVAAAVASGFYPEWKTLSRTPEPTGNWRMTNTCSAYVDPIIHHLDRLLNCNPQVEQPWRDSKHHTSGTEAVFVSGVGKGVAFTPRPLDEVITFVSNYKKVKKDEAA